MGATPNGAMEVSCRECGYDLWAEEIPEADRFRVWACFDDEEQSDTYTQQIGRYPGCGARLNAQALSAAHEKVRPGELRPARSTRRTS